MRECNWYGGRVGKQLLILGSFLAISLFVQNSSFAQTSTNSLFKKAASRPALVKKGKDKTYLYLGGRNGLLLCFHGRGGSAQGWTKGDKRKYLSYFQRMGYSFICPSSSSKQWQNSDVKKVNALLNGLGISKNHKIFIVGHSNGGGFASKFAATSRRNIQAIHFANASGVEQILGNRKWKFPIYYSYAKCDKVVNHKKIENSYRKAKVKKSATVLDLFYHLKKDKKCHEFINVSGNFYGFIQSTQNRSRARRGR